MKKRKCKRCNGTGRVFEGKGGDDGSMRILGMTIATGENSADGKKCPRCGGRGEI